MSRTLRVITLAAAGVVAAAFLLFSPGAATPSAAPDVPTTYVSITFDDGLAEQWTARSILASHDMRATFYVNSGTVGVSSRYLTWQQLTDLAADGHEIAGHTVLHEDLRRMDADEQRREICDDRATLASRGFTVTDFAYPFGSGTSATRAIVEECGYVTLRAGTQFDEVDPPIHAESVPPPDPYDLRTPPGVTSSTSLATIQSWVTDAEANGGGWVEIRLHHLCDACDPDSMTVANFTALLDWLAPRATNGTVVKTVHETFGGDVRSVVEGPPAPAPGNGFGNTSLETSTYVSGVPDCWEPQGYGTNTFAFSRTADAHSGSFGERLDITAYTNGARYLVGKRDLGQCSPSVVPGAAYRLGVWYKSTAPVRFTPFYRDAVGGWRPLGNGSIAYPAATGWSPLYWITPAVPADATAITFGLQLESVGSLTTDDYSIEATETVPPSVAVTAPASGSTVAGSVDVTADASDNVAVDRVDFFRNGILIGTDSSAPYAIAWDTTAASNGPHPITATAIDTSLNSTTSAPVSLTVSNTPAVGVNNYSLEADVDTNGVPDCWEPRGSAPQSTGTYTRVGDAHTGAFAERVDYAPIAPGQDQKLLTAFDTRCAVAVTPGQYHLSAWYKSTTPVRFFAYTRTTGSFSFFRQSPLLPAAATWTRAVWTPAAVPAGTTYLSFGLGIGSAGSLTTDDYNLTPATDLTLPTVSLTAPATNSTVSGTAVTISANAADNVGVDRVVFYVDGQVVGSATTSPYAIAWDSRTVANGSHSVTATVFDSSGNTQTAGPRPFNVQNETTPPTVSLTAPADGATVSGTAVAIAADASDNVGVDHVDFYVGATNVGTDSVAPYATSWNSRSVANGTYSVTAVAFDVNGNSATSTPRSVTTANDVAGPTSSIACNGGSCNGWFPAGVVVTLSAVDDTSGVAAIRYTLDGSTPTEASTPYVGPFVLSETTTVKYRAWDNDGNVEPVNTQDVRVDSLAPTSTITCNGSSCGGWYASASIGLSASDSGGSGLDRIVYTTDGSEPTQTNGTTYTAPFTVSATTTVRYRSYDLAGNGETVQNQLVQIDAAAPTTSLSCNGTTCATWYAGSTSISLSATDSGGSGLARTVYTTNGSTPTQTNGTTYTAPFTVSATTTVRYRSFDVVGNAEAVQSQLVQIDTVAPTTSITCNGGNCNGWFRSATVSLTATDTGGSGVARIVFTTDGSTPTQTNGTTYVAPFAISVTTDLRYRAYDVVGNTETVRSRQILIDSIAPSVAITQPANGATVSGNVTIGATATDTGGSAVANVKFYADGTLLGTSSRSPYSTSWNTKKVPKGQHTLTAIATDNAGNTQTSAAIVVTVA
jgi:peptidoglycan/xylan/chitin deacetylase (PgdA/CDA1 family)